MQIQLVFSTDMLNLPFSYNDKLQGLIYKIIGDFNPVYSEALHNRGKETNQNLVKFFTFGRLKGDYRINKQRNEIIFPKEAALEIRSTDDLFVTNFLSGYRKGEMYKIGSNHVRLESCVLKNRIITSEEITVFTNSPFVYKAPYPEYKIFDAETARQKLLKNSIETWISAGNSAENFKLSISFDGSKPKRVHSVFKGTSIDAWKCSFKMSGNIETLNFFYNAGIGARTSQGYGMFEIED